MDNELISDAGYVQPAGRSGLRGPGSEDAPRSAATALKAGAMAAHVLDDDPSPGRATQGPVERAQAFGSVICADDGGATDDAAR
jgi:hypothetical protein